MVTLCHLSNVVLKFDNLFTIMSPFWAICAFVFLLTTRVGPSFQKTLCDRMESATQVKQLDIRSITKTSDGHLLILQEDSLYELSLAALDTIKLQYNFDRNNSRELTPDWLKLPEAYNLDGQKYRLNRVEVLPTDGDGEAYHLAYGPVSASDRSPVKLFWYPFTKRYSQDFKDVKIPYEQYQTVTDGAGRSGYLFTTVPEDGAKGERVVVKDLNAEIHQLQKRPTFYIERSKDRLNFVKCPDVTITPGKPNPYRSVPHNDDLFLPSSLPVGFIHERQVYLIDLATEEVHIFPYEDLNDIKADELPAHSIERSESLRFRKFFHCLAAGSNVEDDDGSTGGLSGPVQLAILFGGVLLVAGLVGIIVLVINLTRASNQSGQIANYKVKSVPTKKAKVPKKMNKKKNKNKKLPKKTSWSSTTSGTTSML